MCLCLYIYGRDEEREMGEEGSRAWGREEARGGEGRLGVGIMTLKEIDCLMEGMGIQIFCSGFGDMHDEETIGFAGDVDVSCYIK